jgi:hypothetical protein
MGKLGLTACKSGVIAESLGWLRLRVR